MPYKSMLPVHRPPDPGLSADCPDAPGGGAAQQPRFQLPEVRNPGVGVALSCARARNSSLETRRWYERIAGYLHAGMPLTISLQGLGRGRHDENGACKRLQTVCEMLAGLVGDSGYDTRRLGLCVQSHIVPVETFALVTNALLGSGPRYVFLDNLQMKHHLHHRIADDSGRIWRALWQFRGSELRPVYGGVVRSACTLLSDEVATAVLPGAAAVVPHHTAWVTIPFALTSFAGANGDPDWDRLSPAVAAAVRAGDRLHDEGLWACAEQHDDAVLNRRIAIVLSGIGDIVQLSSRNPRDLSTLDWVAGIVNRVKSELHAASKSLARCVGPMPSVSGADPAIGLRPGPARETWRRRWEVAARETATRHRNLLALSPATVLPSHDCSCDGYIDLLPVIRQADAWCFPATRRYNAMRLQEYEEFHRRAWAVINGHGEGCVVAAGG